MALHALCTTGIVPCLAIDILVFCIDPQEGPGFTVIPLVAVTGPLPVFVAHEQSRLDETVNV